MIWTEEEEYVSKKILVNQFTTIIFQNDCISRFIRRFNTTRHNFKS